MTSFKAFRPHISIDVRDIQASVEFYTSLFGQAPTKQRPGYAKFALEQPALNFSLNEREHGASGSLSHLGFEVLSTNEVIAAKERLEASGVTVREEMETTCCYAKQDKIWVSDPDHNAWEIFVVTEADTAVSSDEDGSACCVPSLVQIGEACC